MCIYIHIHNWYCTPFDEHTHIYIYIYMILLLYHILYMYIHSTPFVQFWCRERSDRMNWASQATLLSSRTVACDIAGAPSFFFSVSAEQLWASVWILWYFSHQKHSESHRGVQDELVHAQFGARVELAAERQCRSLTLLCIRNGEGWDAQCWKACNPSNCLRWRLSWHSLLRLRQERPLVGETGALWSLQKWVLFNYL